MPRKVNYEVDDYDDGYYDYEDYDYQYDVEDHVSGSTCGCLTKWYLYIKLGVYPRASPHYGDHFKFPFPLQGQNKTPEKNQETIKTGLWRCPICTFDNDDDLFACDICGVLRNPLITRSNNTGKETVDGIRNDSGASIMAKSLFASMPHRAPQKAVVCQQRSDDPILKEGSDFLMNGTSKGRFHDFHKAGSSAQINYHINIAPFKFDVPSPDDMVSSGLRSSKITSKGFLSMLPKWNLEMWRVLSVEALFFQFLLSSVKMVALEDSVVQSSTDTCNRNDSHANPVVLYLGNDVMEVCLANLKSSNVSSSAMGKNTSVRTQSNFERMEDLSVPSTGSGDVAVREKNFSSGIDGSTQGIPSKLNHISLEVKSASEPTRKPVSIAEYKSEKWMLPDQKEGKMTQLSLAIVGHVDSGKSTLSGRLLHLLGRISQKEMHKYEKEAKQQGKGSFSYAWALDESAEERERGITMTVAVAYFDSKRYHVVLLDSPGHKDFVPNMISGATQADAAILVIDSSVGSFEAGLDKNRGQTREHAQLIRSFGVDQIIVAVNKMDVVGYSKERFDFIKQQLGAFLHSCGFKDSMVSWIPVSAMENQNLVGAPSDVRLSSWYKGSHLLDAIDSIQPPSRDFSKPLRMPICDVIRSQSSGQVSACGKVEAGALRTGFKVLVLPSGDVGTVRSLERDSQACSVARAGDNVAVALQGIDAMHVMPGGVLCHRDFPVAIAKTLELKVLMLDVEAPILIGSHLEFHVHHAKAAGRVVKILSLLDSKTGKMTKKAPRCLMAKQSAVIRVVLDEAVCVEEYSSCRALGRVSVRASGRTVAVGIVDKIINVQEQSIQ
ncbi:Translation elongation factor EFTu/EF1A, C-terminal [Dillenia turbinata]|uniref:Translation elongation factor EFTu/EF1A, C-terminal n=1 Tax=Dillenia turbinata TaxID=194707 RepID=A0AAN8YUS5_9MAGN